MASTIIYDVNNSIYRSNAAAVERASYRTFGDEGGSNRLVNQKDSCPTSACYTHEGEYGKVIVPSELGRLAPA